MQAETVDGKLYSGNNNGNSVDNKDIVYGPFARYHYFCGLYNYKDDVDVDDDDGGTEMESIDDGVDDGEMKSKTLNGIRDFTNMTNNDGEEDDDSIPNDIDLFIANRKDEDILPVYPFEVDKKKSKQLHRILMYFHTKKQHPMIMKQFRVVPILDRLQSRFVLKPTIY
jgi:hypothetical protein